MSLSSPTTCCMAGLFSGELAVQRNATCRHSAISRSTSVPAASSRSLASTMLRPFRFRTTPRAQLVDASSHFACPVTSSKTRVPKL
uniref:Uncharacterized protein n=1 Tax=Arundo donax TaxID=35708 RepID=A0A0A9FVX8_ARUDO